MNLPDLMWNLKARRINTGLEQKDVAERMTCSPSFVCQIESGRRDVTVSTLLRYMEAIGLEVRL